nr:hypothetical protein [Escherichia fergusonii]
MAGRQNEVPTTFIIKAGVLCFPDDAGFERGPPALSKQSFIPVTTVIDTLPAQREAGGQVKIKIFIATQYLGTGRCMDRIPQGAYSFPSLLAIVAAAIPISRQGSCFRNLLGRQVTSDRASRVTSTPGILPLWMGRTTTGLPPMITFGETTVDTVPPQVVLSPERTAGKSLILTCDDPSARYCTGCGDACGSPLCPRRLPPLRRLARPPRDRSFVPERRRHS